MLDGDGLRVGAAENAAGESADVEGIEAVAEQHEGGGCHHDRRGGGEGHGRDAGVGERLEKVHGEKDQYGHRQRDGRGGEHHGAARGHHHPGEGLLAARALGQLVAEPADHQQRVVDGQRQTHGGGEVEREDRHVGGEGDESQDGEGAQDRHDADGDR